MNYIKSLQEKNKELKTKISSALNELQSFTIFLNSSKFTGVESDGGRKDWIATGDVIIAINEIKNLLPGERELEINS